MAIGVRVRVSNEKQQSSQHFTPGRALSAWEIGFVASSGVAAAATSWGLIQLWPRTRLAVGTLFTRLVRPRIIDHEIRARIVELVRQEPGIHGHGLATRLQIGNGQATHHLRVLVRAQILTRLRVFGSQAYFLAGRYSTDRMRAIAGLRSRPLRRLYEHVRRFPGQRLSHAAGLLGLSVPRVSRLARRLEQVGLLERQRMGRSVLLRPTPHVGVTG